MYMVNIMDKYGKAILFLLYQVTIFLEELQTMHSLFT